MLLVGSNSASRGALGKAMRLGDDRVLLFTGSIILGKGVLMVLSGWNARPCFFYLAGLWLGVLG